jgi:hypothetical protein
MSIATAERTITKKKSGTPSKLPPVSIRTGELEPDDQKVEQLSPVDMGMGNTPFERPTPPEIDLVEKPLEKDQAKLLAFNEEPVTIRCNQGAGDNAPLYMEAWVQGKGIERYYPKHGWIEVKHIPVEEECIIKRKYLEVMLRSKALLISTPEDRADGSEPRNLVIKRSVNTHSITIVEDKDPPGEIGYRREWARRIQRLPV